MMTKYLFSFIFLFYITSSFAQIINTDAKATQLIAEGKALFAQKKFAEATDIFENALLRPFNTSTTTAMYLSGLASYYNKDWVNAVYRLTQLITTYPKSKYIGDAQYHLALAEMNSTNLQTQAIGLERIYALREVVKEVPFAIMNEAKQASKRYAFNQLSSQVLAIYYKKVAEKNKQELMEAICYRHIKENHKNEAELIYQNYLSEGKATSPFVENLLLKATQPLSQNTVAAPIVSIAVMLPFFAPDNIIDIDTFIETPVSSQLPLELYEGLIEGFEAFSQYSKKKYFIKIFDTKRDNATVEMQLQELETLQPEIIIGEIYNKQSRLISEWVSQHPTTQLIPLSPTHSLVENKNNVFLMNPSTTTHGYKMAEYAFRDLGLRKVTIWTDSRTSTAALANAFAARFQVMGGTPVMAYIDSVYSIAQPQILNAKDKFTLSEGVYIPVNNEEIVGLILSLIDANRYKLKVMALPEIELYEQIERETKEFCGIYFTSTYSPAIESQAYQSYLNEHFLAFNAPPTEYHIRGYDLGQYIGQICDDFNGGDLNQFIRDYVPVSGIHIQYDFNREQDNQGIKIQQYTVEGIINVK